MEGGLNREKKDREENKRMEVTEKEEQGGDFFIHCK